MRQPDRATGVVAGRRAASARRIAILDIGSNTVRLVVYEGSERTPELFFNEKATCRLGACIEDSGQLDAMGRERALASIARFRTLLPILHVDVVEAVATAAVREAADGQDFVQEVEDRTGIRVRILGGTEEAELAARGVLLGSPEAEGLVADLGGGSLEIARLAQGRAEDCMSLPIGSLRIALPADSSGKINRAIKTQLDRSVALGERHARLYLVGGAWRAMARIHMQRTGYPINVLQGYALRRKEALELARWTRARTPEALRRSAAVSDARVEVVPYAALVLDRLVKRVRPKQVVFSIFGLREGLYFNHLDARHRAEDPLLAACAAMEERRARSPGYGAELYRWLWPLFGSERTGDARLVHACCLANDVEWRENPDYRAAIAFETMMRVTVSGVSHVERLFVASALLFRHKGGRRVASKTPGIAMLTPDQLSRAEALGAAMRMAATLTGACTGVLPRCRLGIDKSRIVVNLPGALAGLDGESVRRDLETLGQAMSRRTRLDVAEE